MNRYVIERASAATTSFKCWELVDTAQPRRVIAKHLLHADAAMIAAGLNLLASSAKAA